MNSPATVRSPLMPCDQLFIFVCYLFNPVSEALMIRRNASNESGRSRNKQSWPGVSLALACKTEESNEYNQLG